MANITEVLKTDIMHRMDYVRTSTGDRQLISGLDNYKQWLFNCLITEPGSLVHRPNFGVGIKRYQGGPLTLAKQREIAVRIQEQYEKDPRTDKVTGISISTDPKIPSLTYIVVRVKPVGYDEIEMKFTPFEG